FCSKCLDANLRNNFTEGFSKTGSRWLKRDIDRHNELADHINVDNVKSSAKEFEKSCDVAVKKVSPGYEVLLRNTLVTAQKELPIMHAFYLHKLVEYQMKCHEAKHSLPLKHIANKIQYISHSLQIHF